MIGRRGFHQAATKGKRHVARLTVASFAVAIVALGVSATSGATVASKVTSHAAPSTVTVRLTGDFACLDPAILACSGNIPGADVLAYSYDTLMAIGKNGAVLPYLATSWKITPTKMVFTIAKGVTCSNGQKMGPSAVADSLRNYFARYAAAGGNLVSIFGAAPYTVSANNSAGTVTVGLSQPEPLAYLNFSGSIFIVCPAGLGPATNGNPLAQYNTASYGSGPYTLVSTTHGQGATLKLRPNWKWGPGGTTAANLPKKIVLDEVTDDTTAANLLLTGGLDISQVSGPDISRLLANKSLTAAHIKGFLSNLISLNETPGHVTDDVNVRKAIEQAINAKAYGYAALGPGYSAATNILSSSTQCYQNDSKLIAPYSAAGAKATLTADGYTLGANGYFQKNGQTLTLNLVSTTAGLNQAGAYLTSAFNAAGMAVNAKIEPFANYAADGYVGNFDVFTDTLGGGSPAPGSSASVLIGPNGTDFDHADDPTAYTLEQQASSSSGCKLWKQFYARMISNYNIVPAVYPVTYWFTRDGIRLVPAVEELKPEFINVG